MCQSNRLYSLAPTLLPQAYLLPRLLLLVTFSLAVREKVQCFIIIHNFHPPVFGTATAPVFSLRSRAATSAYDGASTLITGLPAASPMFSAPSTTSTASTFVFQPSQTTSTSGASRADYIVARVAALIPWFSSANFLCFFMWLFTFLFPWYFFQLLLILRCLKALRHKNNEQKDPMSLMYVHALVGVRPVFETCGWISFAYRLQDKGGPATKKAKKSAVQAHISTYQYCRCMR